MLPCRNANKTPISILTFEKPSRKPNPVLAGIQEVTSDSGGRIKARHTENTDTNSPTVATFQSFKQTPQQWRPLAVILPSENVFRRIHSRRHRCRGVCRLRGPTSFFLSSKYSADQISDHYHIWKLWVDLWYVIMSFPGHSIFLFGRGPPVNAT